MNIPLCFKCSSRKTAPVKNCSAFTVVGCVEMSQEEWDKGYKRNEGEVMPYQHNCPILPKEDKNA